MIAYNQNWMELQGVRRMQGDIKAILTSEWSKTSQIQCNAGKCYSISDIDNNSALKTIIPPKLIFKLMELGQHAPLQLDP